MWYNFGVNFVILPEGMQKHFFRSLTIGSACGSRRESRTSTEDEDLEEDCDRVERRRPLGATLRLAARRPPPGDSMRRWNSFHAPRGECHPNKIRRERKATSPCISEGSSDSWRRQLSRGRSLAEKPDRISWCVLPLLCLLRLKATNIFPLNIYFHLDQNRKL